MSELLARSFQFLLLLLVLYKSTASPVPASTKNPICAKGPPANIDVYDCCKFPKMYSNKTLLECAKENDYKLEAKLDDIENTCVIECFFQKSKILANDTTIDERSLHDHFDMMLVGEPDWLHVAPLSTDKCLKDLTPEVMDEILKEMQKEPVINKKVHCSPITTLFLDCFLIDLFEKCPDTKITNSDKCTELKNYLEHCDDD